MPATCCCMRRAGSRRSLRTGNTREDRRMNGNWRVYLAFGLLLGAVVSGWSVWRHHALPEADADGGGRSDFVLHDYEIIALDKDGKEAFTLLGPVLRETPGKKTME